MLRQLELADMDAASRVHRAAFDRALPTLAGLHTPDEDRWLYRERVFGICEVWGAFDGTGMTAVLAFREGWIDQRAVYGATTRRGHSALLQVAQNAFDRLQLWTFQCDGPARRFYEARGFTLVRETDGAANEGGNRTRSISGCAHKLTTGCRAAGVFL